VLHMDGQTNIRVSSPRIRDNWQTFGIPRLASLRCPLLYAPVDAIPYFQARILEATCSAGQSQAFHYPPSPSTSRARKVWGSVWCLGFSLGFVTPNCTSEISQRKALFPAFLSCAVLGYEPKTKPKTGPKTEPKPQTDKVT
jgi:hypothetical protein